MIKVKLYEHQVKAFDFVMNIFKNRSGAALLMEMGTGKTLTSLAVIDKLYSENKIHKLLIVAPLSIVNVWKEEFDKFADIDTKISLISSADKELIAKHEGKELQIIIVNYESMWRCEKELQCWSPDMIICDESTKIKNVAAKATKALIRLGDWARYKLILTGTPINNKLTDIYSQYRFLDKTCFGSSFYLFRNTYFHKTGYGGYTYKVNKTHESKIKSKIHELGYRVTMSEAVELPECVDEYRQLTLEPNAQRIYTELEKTSFHELLQGDITATNVLTKLLRLSQVTGGYIKGDQKDAEYEQISSAKLNALEDIIEQAEQEVRKVVVFVRFKAEIDAIVKMLKRLGIGYSLIMGSVKSADRAVQISNFQSDESCRVFVGQLATCGMGITLTAGSIAVYYSLDYSYSNYEQSRARIYRIGQKNNCLYIHLIAKNTVDEEIMNALVNKRDIAAEYVDRFKKEVNDGRAKHDEPCR